jgi:hypothetical protein
VILLAWGALWWLGAVWREIGHWLPRDTRTSAGVGLLTLTAIAFAFAERRVAWPAARIPAFLLLPALLLIAMASIVRPWRVDAFWLSMRICRTQWVPRMAVRDRRRRMDAHAAERDDAADSAGIALPLDFWHAGCCDRDVALRHNSRGLGPGPGTASGDGAMGTRRPSRSERSRWPVVRRWRTSRCALRYSPLGRPAGSPEDLRCALHSPLGRPAGSWPSAFTAMRILIIGATPIAVVLALWSLGVNVESDGDPLPLPYIPLFNPLDITVALALLALATWALCLGREKVVSPAFWHPGLFAAIFALLAFVWINGLALRTIHFWFDVPFTFRGLWQSRLVQAVLALLWSLLALGTMVLANRRYWRVAWIAGALLLALVVAKLFLVDLSQVGGVERIVSFIGVGLLLLLIGYLAPVPPRRPETPA